MKDLFKGAALFIGGAMVGAAAMMLLAPKAGEEACRQISDLASEAKKRTQDLYEQVKAEIEADTENETQSEEA